MAMMRRWLLAMVILVLGLAADGQCRASEVRVPEALQGAVADRALKRTGVGSGERRVALVIGNDAYPTAPLRNPTNDARAMAAVLRVLGFEVIERINAGKADMEKAVIDFGGRLSEDSVGLVYYSGHGLQVSGRNYLIPVDAEISSERMVPLMAVDADNVLAQMMEARSRVNILILDACRNNPFERPFRALNGGLAQMSAPKGTMIAYATAPGKTANDGSGGNGLYTKELLKAIQQPGLPIEQVFKKVRAAVSSSSGDAQIPWEASSLTGDFYFAGTPDQGHQVAAVMTPPAVLTEQPGRDMRYGIGPFHLGMSAAQVNRKLGTPFVTVQSASLPIAGEYKNNEVRYFWKYFSEDTVVASMILKIPKGPCLSPQSYLTFLFLDDSLFRISFRLYRKDGCSDYRSVVENLRSKIFGKSSVSGHVVVTHSDDYTKLEIVDSTRTYPDLP
ncbi:hypothetical protein J2847_004522 [Azospirillum agricola]|uniref:caspase family protein n=1 Tax=Azospirillum agricola TaxID=1720247 RepID=UPI001AE0F977|nr:caspase family protein [Azospirillum agricola]MBP2231210.1 hypothetical protein [Azospirillum agricola]